jgi:hypothetical protein
MYMEYVINHDFISHVLNLDAEMAKVLSTGVEAHKLPRLTDP